MCLRAFKQFSSKGWWLLAVGCYFYSSMLYALREVQGLRVWTAPESARVVLDLTGHVQYKVFTLNNPERIVIDIEGARFKASLNKNNWQEAGIMKIRHSHQENGKLRVVLDMNQRVKPSSFLLSPNATYGHRLVLDMSYTQKPNSTNKTSQSIPKINELTSFATREFIVAIDAGHGGEDTGAIGRNLRLREKDVVLKVAQKLANMVNSQRGMRALLVRSGDYYIGLRKRMDIARQQGADLFISIHADSFNDPRASGASVFVLSEKGASNEAARWLAESENRADLIGGVSLDDKGGMLASVLLDLSQTASQSASQELASHLISNLAKVTDMHHKTVQHAGFMVLKSPDIPSVLVELGFVSNKIGEEKLANFTHQQVLATALLSGVKTYVAKRPAPLKHPEEWNMAKKNGQKSAGLPPESRASFVAASPRQTRG